MRDCTSAVKPIEVAASIPVVSKVVEITARSKPTIWFEYLARMPPMKIGKKFLNTVVEDPRSTLTWTLESEQVSMTWYKPMRAPARMKQAMQLVTSLIPVSTEIF